MGTKSIIDGYSTVGDVRSTTPFWVDLPAALKVYMPDNRSGFDLYLKSKNLAGSTDPRDTNWVGMYDSSYFGPRWSDDAKDVLKNLEFEFHASGDCLYAKNLNYVAKPKPEEEVFIPHGVGDENWQIGEFLLAQLRTRQLVASITWVELATMKAGDKELEKFQGREDYLGEVNRDADGQVIKQKIVSRYRTAYTWPGC